MNAVQHQTEIELVMRLWPFFVSVVLVVAWFIRVEAMGAHTREKVNEFIKRFENENREERESKRQSINELWRALRELERNNNKEK